MFLTNNKVWATLAPTLEEVYNFMLAKTSEMLDWQQELRDSGTIAKDTSFNYVKCVGYQGVLGREGQGCGCIHRF